MGEYESSGTTYEEEQFQVYADHCLVCNQQCFLSPNKTQADESPKDWIISMREVIYTAFNIPVSLDVIEESKTELPLCTKCVFTFGKLRSVHLELQKLMVEYSNVKEEIAFSVVDIVASKGATKPHLINLGNFSTQHLDAAFKNSEVECIQQMIFDRK